MLLQVNGAQFLELVKHGIKNLELNRQRLNDLNVFPVPDGDTGTNMLMTLRYGFESVRDADAPLHRVAAKLATSASFGARGNSGVILSQFFKGLADGLSGCETADAATLSAALTSAYKFAYTSVAKPVEGTMLTVMREAADGLAAALPIGSVDEAISTYLAEARRSLEHTPDLLPILRKAGVVDSGGSGVVCFFEGVEKYLRGEPIGAPESTEECEVFDFSLVNKDTRFDYGYCVEGLIQLRCEPDAFDRDGFKAGLEKLGNSIVSTVVGDKLKIHIHTKRLSRLMDYCQAVGEFLTIKIENMTLQNLAKKSKEEPMQKFLIREDDGECSFAIVAAATNRTTQRMFSEMGADVVIMSELAPSSQDFIDAFRHIKGKRNILVFPNSPNSILTSMQAGTMYRDAVVTVINSRSVAACYSALAMIDFSEDASTALATANRVISGITEFSLYLATKDVQFGSRRIKKNEFFSMHGDRIYDTGATLEIVTLATLRQVLEKNEFSVITVFYNSDIADEYIEQLAEKINGLGFDIEVATVMTGESSCSLTVTCE